MAGALSAHQATDVRSIAAQYRKCLITHSQKFASSTEGREERERLNAMERLLRGTPAEQHAPLATPPPAA